METGSGTTVPDSFRRTIVGLKPFLTDSQENHLDGFQTDSHGVEATRGEKLSHIRR